ncbi:hypothetical protein C8R42DRAFT_690190, partial [Lentinula raphanica]
SVRTGLQHWWTLGESVTRDSFENRRLINTISFVLLDSCAKLIILMVYAATVKETNY